MWTDTIHKTHTQKFACISEEFSYTLNHSSWEQMGFCKNIYVHLSIIWPKFFYSSEDLCQNKVLKMVRGRVYREEDKELL